MPILYQPRGKAAEFASHAANFYKGCSHGCTYCYAPKALHQERSAFHTNPTVREGAIAKFAVECMDARGTFQDGESVLISFSSDPYQPLDSEKRITRAALAILAVCEIPATVLTKGGVLAAKDFDVMKANAAGTEFGTSLVWIDDKKRQEWEPNAAPVSKRFLAIDRANAKGLKTWVSLEPVIDPVEAIAVMKAMGESVDGWKVGKINYHPEIEQAVDWVKFCDEIRDLQATIPLKNVYIKESLKPYWKESCERNPE